MATLKAAEIVQANDAQYVVVEVPEWGGTVRLRSLTGEEIVQFIDNNAVDKKTAAVRLITMTAVDDDGNLIFTAEHIPLLQKKNLRVILRLQDAAMKLSALNADEAAAAKNV